jgi:hypothetical protein
MEVSIMATQTRQPAKKQTNLRKWHDLVRKAWMDADFKARLLDNPLAVLREEGWDIPAGKQVRIVENTTDVMCLTLPAAPPVAELILTPEQMDRIADVSVLGTPTHASHCRTACYTRCDNQCRGL